MTRPLRIEYAGVVYHVTFRGNERKPVFKSDQDRVTQRAIARHPGMHCSRISIILRGAARTYTFTT